MTQELIKAPATMDSRCGTYKGYKAHLWRQEETCLQCRAANTEYYKNLRANNPQHREKAKEAMRRWYDSHREEQAQYRSDNAAKRLAYRIANRERDNEVKRQSRALNPEETKQSIRRANRRRRARHFQVIYEDYTDQQILDIYGANCHICREPIDLNAPRTAKQKGYERGLHLDHVIPLALGGTDLIENVKPSHVKCNLIKGQSVKESGNKC